jgi:DNA invertase Pin-like site-specific DNA recombinase
VYVRQSSAQQVRDHTESTRLQYGLAERAAVLGWAASRVLVIDDDLGHSASGADARPGFQRLVSEVGLDHVGIVLGIEMSRLARSGREWHQLLELCALSGTLLGDMDGVYDPVPPGYSIAWVELPFMAAGLGRWWLAGWVLLKIVYLLMRWLFGLPSAWSADSAW